MKSVIRILLIIALLIMCLTNTTFARLPPDDEKAAREAAAADKTMAELNRMKDPIEVGNTSDKVGDIVNSIVVVVQVVGTGIAFIIILVLAMKYMTAAPGDKADIKKSAFIYLIGAIVVFGVPTILRIIMSFAGNIK